MGSGHLFSIQREKKQKEQQKQTNKQNNFNFALSRSRGIGVCRLVYYQLMARVFENVNNTQKNGIA